MSAPPYVISALTIAETLRSALKTMVHAASYAALGHPDVQAQSSARILEWSTRLLSHTDTNIRVHGRENVLPGERYLVLTNHQSQYDIPIVFVTLGGDLRMLAKRELFDVPLFGHAMRFSGFVPIDRGDRAKARESLDEMKRLVASGLHVWMAPEGSRSPDGKLGPFKKGAFHLAVDGKLPVLPVTLRGTGKVLPAKSFRSQPGLTVDVTIHPPIRRADLPEPDEDARDEFLARVRAAIESGL